MRSIPLFLAALLATESPSLAQDQTAPARPPHPGDPGALDLAAPPPTATLSYGADPLQRGELRLPQGPGPHPVAIMIHGGCWSAKHGSIDAWRGFAEGLRKRGIATWAITYRRVGNAGGGWPGTFEDISAGIDHLSTAARSHPLDLGRVTVIGHSAGALFSLWSAARAKLPAPYAQTTVRPVSVVAVDGPGQLAEMIGIDAQVCEGPAIVPFMGGTPAEQPERYRLATPAAHLPLGVPQLFVLGALGQFMGPYVDMARKAGDPVVTIAPEGSDHFNIVRAGTPQAEAVMDWVAAEAFRKR